MERTKLTDFATFKFKHLAARCSIFWRFWRFRGLALFTASAYASPIESASEAGRRRNATLGATGRVP